MRLYDRLFRDAQPDAGERSFLDNLNPDSLQVLTGCKAERSLAGAAVGQTFQFEREGYFCRDPEPAANGQVVFNRTIGLRDVWSEAGKG